MPFQHIITILWCQKIQRQVKQLEKHIVEQIIYVDIVGRKIKKSQLAQILLLRLIHQVLGLLITKLYAWRCFYRTPLRQ